MSFYHIPPIIFYLEDAKKYGINEALLIQYFRSMINFHVGHRENFNEERTWMNSSHKEIAEDIEYFSTTQIKRLIVRLVKFKVLRRGKFNKTAWDKTSWYAFEDEKHYGIPANKEVSK